MESRTVKFNIKNFIEDYVYAHNSKDIEEEENLIKGYKEVLSNSSEPVATAMQSFIFNNKIAKDYPVLQALASMCLPIFKN